VAVSVTSARPAVTDVLLINVSPKKLLGRKNDSSKTTINAETAEGAEKIMNVLRALRTLRTLR
jgi:hypothetical protein